MTLKIIATWSAPEPGRADEFEEAYWGKHIPLARRVPDLLELNLTLTSKGVGGAPSDFYRVAELVFADEETYLRSASSPEWTAMNEDAAEIISRFDVTLQAGVGESDS